MEKKVFEGNELTVEISRREQPRPKTPGKYMGVKN